MRLRLSRGPGAQAAAFGLAALALYLATLSPGVAWGDSAQLQRAAALPRFAAGARDYPLWTALAAALARLLPVSPALAANLLSAFAGAAAVACTSRYVASISGSGLAAAAAAAATLVAHLFWSSSLTAEVYSLAVLLLVTLLLTARIAAHAGRRGPAIFGAAIGVCLLHHRMLIVAAAGLATVLLLEWRRNRSVLRPALVTLGGLGIGGAPFLVLLFVGAAAGTWDQVLLGGFGARLPAGLGLGNGLLGLLLYEAKFLAFNLAGLQLLFAVLGGRALAAISRFDRRALLTVGGLSLLQALLFPHIGDRYMLLLPAIWVTCVLAGLGADRLLVRRTAPWPAIAVLVVLAGPALVYWTAGHSLLLSRLGLISPSATRQATEFLRRSRADDDAPRRYALRILSALPPDAVLVANWGEGEVIRYLKSVESRRPDVSVRTVDHDRRRLVADALRTHRPVFVSAFPLIEMDLETPPGARLEVVLPDILWRVDPTDQR